MIGGIKVGRRTAAGSRAAVDRIRLQDFQKDLCDQVFEFHLTLIQAQAIGNRGSGAALKKRLPLKCSPSSVRAALETSPMAHCLYVSQYRHAPALRGIKQRLKQEEKFPRLREAFSANRGLIESMCGQP